MSQTEQSAGGSLPPADSAARAPRSRGPLMVALLGVAALLVAACIPAAAGLLGPLSFREAMLLLLQVVVAGLVGRFLLELLLRGRSRMARGLGLALVGLLVLGGSGYTTWARVDTNLALQDFRQVVLDAQGLRAGKKEAAARLAVAAEPAPYPHTGVATLAYALAAETRRATLDDVAIEAKFVALEPGSILGSDVLLSADAIVQARGRQSALRVLLEEQAGLVESALTRSEAIHRDTDASDQEADELLKAVDARREVTRNLVRDFDRASRSAIARREEMLVFAQANLGGIRRLRDDNLRFRSRALKAAYDKLDEAVDEAETAEQRAFDALVKQRTENLRAVGDHLASLLPPQQ